MLKSPRRFATEASPDKRKNHILCPSSRRIQELRSSQRKNIEAACVDMWQPFTDSIAEWSPGCRIIYDKFHIMQHANKAVTEVRRAEFFRKGGGMREIVKGKSWLLLTRWVNLLRFAQKCPKIEDF